MMKKIHLVFISANFLQAIISLIMGAILFSSCKVYQPTYYFKDITRDTVIQGFEPKNLEITIQKNDVLAVGVSSLNPTEDALYILGSSAEAKGFQVDPEGNIYMHKLGKLPVAGLSRKQLKQKLEIALSPYLKDPIITVSFVNHRVTVFGEASSQVVNMPEEKIPLLEVLATSHPTTLNSTLDNVMVIREIPGAKQVKHLNLEDLSIVTSPWYYLQPNDIVVVKPNAERITSEARRTRNQLLYATVLSGISFVFLIIDRVFR